VSTEPTSIPPPPQPPTQPSPRGGLLTKQWVRYGLVFIFGLVVGGVAVAGADTSNKGSPEAVAASPVTGVSPTFEAPSPQPSPSPQEASLTKSDVKLSLKTKSKQCFGSAGCNVTVEVVAAVDHDLTAALPRDGQWDVTYKITGDESGPVIGTFSIYGNGKYDVNQEFISTNSSNTPVNITIVSVEKYG
jgi:hypothetical protein